MIGGLWGSLRRNWFLAALIVVLALGMALPEQSYGIATLIPKRTVIGIVLFLMALPLSFDAISQTFRRPGPAILAIAVNSIAVPLIAWPLSRLLNGELAAGLIIAAAVPTTIASATVWTRLAGGNEAVSMLVTVVTNLSCFLVTPAWIWLVLRKKSETESFAVMATELLILVVLPIVAAQVVHRVGAVARFAAATKPLLSGVAQLGLLSIVFLGATHCGRQLAQLDGRLTPVIGQIVLMTFLVAVVHTLAWFLGFRSSNTLGFAYPDSLAVGFAGSQKTLMVGLAIALDFGGLTILPLVAYHVEQLLIDTLLAHRLRRSEQPDPAVAAIE